MVKKHDLELAATLMIILAGILLLICGVVFYTTFKQPIMTVVIPELDALQAWTAVGMVLSVVAIVIAMIQHFINEIIWFRIFLILIITMEIILELLMTVLLFRNTNYVANSIVLIVISFLAVALLIVATIFFVRQFYSSKTEIKKNK